jgi:hypothetical protein
MTETKRGKGRPSLDVVAPKITVGREQQEQIVGLAENRGTKVSVLYRQALALALPQMSKWRRYSSKEWMKETGPKWVSDLEAEPDKYNVGFSDADILAAGFNPAKFGEYNYSILKKAWGEHKKGARVIIEPLQDGFDIAIEL